jgi:polyribonucleotide nucleotidyltransferase
MESNTGSQKEGKASGSVLLIDNNNDARSDVQQFRRGPLIHFKKNADIARHAYASVLATCGDTVVLSTVAARDLDTNSDNATAATATQSDFWTVEYRQRVAAVGAIPGNRRRSDYTILSREEILASRCIDRAIRPLLRPKTQSASASAVHYHVHTSVQCYNLHPHHNAPHNDDTLSTSGHPVATALNATAMAVQSQLVEPVAATVLAVWSDGSIVQDGRTDLSSSSSSSLPVHCLGELLYAGTRTHAVMMEWTSVHAPLPEAQWPRLLAVAAAALQPILDAMEAQSAAAAAAAAVLDPDHKSASSAHVEDEAETMSQLRESLGLSPLPDAKDAKQMDDQLDATDSALAPQPPSLEKTQWRQNVLSDSIQYSRRQLGRAPSRLFGALDEGIARDGSHDQVVFVHDENANKLLSKSYRGRRETIVNEEIARIVDEYLVSAGYSTSNSSVDASKESAAKNGQPILSLADRQWLYQQTTYALFRHALWEASSHHGTRSDGRQGPMPGQGWKTIRPLRLQVPALPNAVHGSALFARGDTQVLCTVTLGAPREGQPWSDPYQPPTRTGAISNATADSDQESAFAQLPVGSLRFLRSQEALESDLNSRKSKADKERTGESGNLAEVKRAFLQYDFPAYSTGDVPKGGGGPDRRSVGHGALAERAILPALPDQHDFPYAIRITSEVTDSNGSSSMASVCGATLALLDAGVPLKEAVAGVSVGLAVGDALDDSMDPASEKNKDYSLLLDITGTEDHVRLLLLHATNRSVVGKSNVCGLSFCSTEQWTLKSRGRALE